MTRKDYILMASIIAGIPEEEIRRNVAHEFAQRLAAANSNFLAEKFLAACLKDPN